VAVLIMQVTRHYHECDEARLVLKGSAFYDIREPETDRWIRIGIETNDLLVLVSYGR
jgi:1,2-dihydroxy-3-keto-5-methylthiopentene dioxygenase